MRVALLTAIVIFCSIFCPGQKAAGFASDVQQIKIARQAAIDDLENQVKNVPLPVVRSFVRYKAASWLWKNGKDETGDASVLALRAFDEIYEKRGEIPDIYFSDLSSHLLSLFEVHSPETAKKLVEKYGIEQNQGLNSAFSLLDKKNGEKLASDKLIKSLENQTELPAQTILLIESLQSRKSPELFRILSEVLSLEERRASDLSVESLFYFVDVFREPMIPPGLRVRFYRLILRKVNQALSSNSGDMLFAFDLINAISPDIPASEAELSAKIGVLKAVLATKISKAAREHRDVYARIEESSNKLEAMVSEADAAGDPGLKESLLTDASNLALKERKFQLAIDLTEKLAELKRIQKKDDPRFKARFDQFMGDVAIQSLKDNEIAINKNASGKIGDKLTRAEILRKTANYFFEKEDTAAASTTLNESLKITNEAEDGAKKIGTLLRLLAAFQKIDKDRISDVTENIAKLIEAFPTLNPDDKPGSENYLKYVNSIMAINANLLPVFNELLKDNRIEAMSFASRINRKEVRIVTGYAITIDILNGIKPAQTQSKYKN